MVGNWRKIEITQEEKKAVWSSEEEFRKHVDLLKNTVFPVIDELLNKKLIENYHFLNYAPPQRLELRFLPVDESKFEGIKSVLKNHGLPEELKIYNENDSESQNTLDVLKLQTEMVRIVINQTKFSDAEGGIKRFYDEITHYPNNALGMNISEEINFHLNKALHWQYDLGFRQGVEQQKKQSQS